MSTIETKGIPPELLAGIQDAVEKTAKGIRDPEAMKLAVESLNRRREEIRRRTGLLDIVVPSLRELRQ
jgi:hypothetical protein